MKHRVSERKERAKRSKDIVKGAFRCHRKRVNRLWNRKYFPITREREEDEGEREEERLISEKNEKRFEAGKPWETMTNLAAEKGSNHLEPLALAKVIRREQGEQVNVGWQAHIPEVEINAKMLWK
jgi:hypothetical protein